MTASTVYGTIASPYYGRLHENRGLGGWCPRTESDRTDYLQVDMGAMLSVCAVATQGQKMFDSWTTSYKLQLSTDGVTWNAYEETNTAKVWSETVSNDYRTAKSPTQRVTKATYKLRHCNQERVCCYSQVWLLTYYSLLITVTIWRSLPICWITTNRLQFPIVRSLSVINWGVTLKE